MDVRPIKFRGCTKKFDLEVVPRGVDHIKLWAIKNECASKEMRWLSEIAKYRTLEYSHSGMFLFLAPCLHIHTAIPPCTLLVVIAIRQTRVGYTHTAQVVLHILLPIALLHGTGHHFTLLYSAQCKCNNATQPSESP